MRTMLAHFGRSVSARELRAAMGISRDCLSATDLKRAAAAYGLECRAIRAEPGALSSRRLPLVAHLNFIHFVVVEAVGPERVRINCPAGGRIELTRAHFDQSFTGIALEMTPGPDFRPDDRTRAGAAEIAWWRWRLRPALGPLALGVAAAGARGAVTVGLAVLLADGARSVVPIAAATGLVALLGLVSARAFARAGRGVSHRLRLDLAARLPDLPGAFHAYRLPEVLVALFEAVRDCGIRLEARVAPALAAVLECLVILAGAAVLAPPAGAALVLVFALWCLLVAVASLHRRRLERATGGGRADTVEAGLAAIERPAAHRIGSAGDAFRHEWIGRLALRRLTELRIARAPACLAAAPIALTLAGLAGTALTAPAEAGALGGLLLLTGALGLAAAPLAGLRGVLGDMRRCGQHAADVLDEPVEPAPERPIAPTGTGLDVRGVGFRFNPKGPPVVDRLSFRVRPGEQVGLCGPSGGGKSTLVGIALGLLSPEAGDVLFGGVPIGRVPRDVRARRLALVDRAPLVFEGTVRENLVLDDSAVSDADLWSAIRDAGFDTVLAARAGGLDAPVQAFGRKFSGGELRRMGIARSLARNPSLLVLDDVVDDLDLATEMRIRAALRRRGCALLLVTHRAASLRAGDRIVRIEGRRAPPVSTAGFSAHGPSPAPEGRIASAAEPSVAALLDAVAHEFGMELAVGRFDLDDGNDRHALVGEGARRRGLRARPVRLGATLLDGVEFGPLLAFRRDGTPLLLRLRDGAMRWSEAGPGGAAGLFDAASLADLDEDAFELSRAASPPATSIRGWRTDLLVGRTGAIGALALLSAARAAALAGVPILAATGGLVSAGLALAAAGCFSVQALDARDRLSADLERAEAEATVALLQDLPGDVGRERRPADLVLGLHGLGDGRKRIQAAVASGMPAAILAAASLAALAGLKGVAVFVPAGALALLMLGPHLAAVAAARAFERPRLEAGRAMRRRLIVLLSGLAPLRLLAADRAMTARWAGEDAAFEAVERRFARRRDAALAVAPGLALGLVAMLCAGSSGSADILAAGWLGWLLAFSVSSLGGSLADTVGGRLRGRAADALLAAPREAGSWAASSGGARLRCTAVGYRYPGSSALVLSGLDLAIDPTRVTVLTGPSGGGKSTLLQLLLGLARPSEGRIELDGRRLDEIDLASWRRGMAAVFQGDRLDVTSTIRGHLRGSGGHDLAAMWEALELVDLAGEVAAMPMGIQTIVGPDTLSSGQQQRLLIARALIGRPRLLVLDEGTNAVPDLLQARLLQRLRARGIGCLTVTHRETLVSAADAVHFIDGTCRFSGTPAEFLRRSDLVAGIAEEETA